MRGREDLEVGDHLEEALLDDAHLVLPGAPHVAEEVVVVVVLDGWGADREPGGDESEAPRLGVQVIDEHLLGGREGDGWSEGLGKGLGEGWGEDWSVGLEEGEGEGEGEVAWVCWSWTARWRQRRRRVSQW